MLVFKMRDLLVLARVYSRATGTKLSSLGRQSCGNQEIFVRLGQGMSCNGRSMEAASDWFIEHWPDEIEWPKAVPDLRRYRRPALPELVEA